MDFYISNMTEKLLRLSNNKPTYRNPETQTRKKYICIHKCTSSLNICLNASNKFWDTTSSSSSPVSYPHAIVSVEIFSPSLIDYLTFH